MRAYFPTAALVVAALLLPGCGAEPAPAPAPAPTAKVDPNDKAPDKPDELRHYMNDPVDKAKASNEQALKDAEAQRKAIEDAGG